MTDWPFCARPNAAERPPMPPPAMRMGRWPSAAMISSALRRLTHFESMLSNSGSDGRTARQVASAFSARAHADVRSIGVDKTAEARLNELQDDDLRHRRRGAQV